MHRVAAALLERETLDAAEIERIAASVSPPRAPVRVRRTACLTASRAELTHGPAGGHQVSCCNRCETERSKSELKDKKRAGVFSTPGFHGQGFLRGSAGEIQTVDR